MYKTAFNPSDSPVTVSASGRIIGGHEWGTVETTDEATSALVQAGNLVLQDPPAEVEGATYNPVATDAYANTEKWADRQEKAQALDNEALYYLAVGAQLTPEVETVGARPNKTELVTLVVESEAEIPTPTQAKRVVREAKTEEKEA